MIADTFGSLSMPTMRLKTYAAAIDRSRWKPFDESIAEVERDDPLAHQMEHFGRVVRGKTLLFRPNVDSTALDRRFSSLGENTGFYRLTVRRMPRSPARRGRYGYMTRHKRVSKRYEAGNRCLSADEFDVATAEFIPYTTHGEFDMYMFQTMEGNARPT